ncbi:hypothetical protein HW561_15680 [Rhodobacteraceae bacterium B1Z28]|uniref:Uncharacterized protein n=1 Tax=Ruegeria haliotis TaxID=2747601 RepID=A0ABX2PSS8_9RHOB|nr:hypothetical protein [Ruegeria haliotis]NVO57233.1 hypothetical protein [Ruegeria haliotis]
MTRYLTASAAALATSLSLGTAALADTTPDLRGKWTGTYNTVQPSHYYKGDEPRFNQAEWVVDIQKQEDNVFWGPSKWRSQDNDLWHEYEVTGSISLDGSGKIGIVETSPLVIGANALIDAQYKDGMIYADFRSLRNGTTYSVVLERQVN